MSKNSAATHNTLENLNGIYKFVNVSLINFPIKYATVQAFKNSFIYKNVYNLHNFFNILLF